MEIKKNTSLAKILKVAGATEILLKYNLPCLGCPFARTEMNDLKIGDICKMYDINTEKLLEELNKKLK